MQTLLLFEFFYLMTVRIANDVGLNKINKKAKELDIYKNTANILSSSLGSGETTLLKITSAYGAFVTKRL